MFQKILQFLYKILLGTAAEQVNQEIKQKTAEEKHDIEQKVKSVRENADNFDADNYH